MKNLLKCFVALMLTAAAALAFADAVQYRLQVDGLACPFCAYGIEKELRRVEHVEQVETHVRDGVVLITVAENQILDEDAIRSAVRKAGFTPRGLERIEPDRHSP